MAGLESYDDARLYTGKSYVDAGQSYVNARLHQKHDITYGDVISSDEISSFTKYFLETTPNVVSNVVPVVIVFSHFKIFWYVWVGISI